MNTEKFSVLLSSDDGKNYLLKSYEELDTLLSEIEARAKASMINKPWMCFIDENEHFMVLGHIHSSIAIHRNNYPKEMLEADEIKTDDNGFLIDEEETSVGENKINTAKFISHSITDIQNLLEIIKHLRAENNRLRDAISREE